MPYTSIADLPSGVRKLPKHAQEIYRSAFNSALKQYNDEGLAAQTAWSQVKKSYKKVGDKWQAKS